MSLVSKKICLVGDFGVGKTSLIRRFVDGKFSDKYLATVGMKLSRKIVELFPQENEVARKIELMIWDLEGQTQFKPIVRSYLQGSQGVILVADVTRTETLESLEEHLNIFVTINPKGLVIVALNKIDLVSEAKLSQLQEKYLVLKHEKIISSYATSAKTGIYVDEIFIKLAHQLS